MNKKAKTILMSISMLPLLLSCTENKTWEEKGEKPLMKLNATSEDVSHRKENAVDQSYKTFWQSEKKENQSLVVDLEKVYQITMIEQTFNQEDIWFFTIEASMDGVSYFQLKDASYGEFGQTFSEGFFCFARYIRLSVIKSMKGFYPSSKELYVGTKELGKGINIIKSKTGDCSSQSGFYDVSKAFDGDYGTYYCASNDQYPQWISTTWEKMQKIKSLHLVFKDYGTYCFEIEGRKSDGSFIKLVEETTITGSEASFMVDAEIDAIVYRVFKGPGWANLVELEVNGFEDLNTCLIENGVLDLKNPHYLSCADIDGLEVSMDGKEFKKTMGSEIDGIYRYVKGLSATTKLFGYNLYSSLTDGLNGKVSSYLDEDHHISKATSEKGFFQSEEKGKESFFEFDLGREAIISSVYQEFDSEERWNFRILASKDGTVYDEIEHIDEIGKSFSIDFKDNNLYRYIKLVCDCSENQYLTSTRFKAMGFGSPVKENWWQRESGVIRFYPKLQKTTLKEITSRLDEFRYSGYKVIELHQPYEGLADIWAGLGGTNNYQVDPIIGNMDDLRNLLFEAHKRGMYIFMFGNVGYGKYNADYFKKACMDYALGIDSKERNWFVFSKTCPDPSKWFYSDIANAYYYGYWGENGKIPTFNFENPEWQKETKKYIDFWARSGVDGIALDAPDVYYWGKSNASKITYQCITNTMRKNNLFSLPEGSGDTKFISSYKYSGVQNYNVSSWGAGAQSLALNAARDKTAKGIDDNIKPFRDTAVALGGVSIDGMNFEDKYLNETGKNRILEAGLVTSTGHLSFLHLGSDRRIGQDIMKEWNEDIQKQVARCFSMQNTVSALNPSGSRHQLKTDDETIYAFEKSNMNGSDMVIPVFNFSNNRKTATITLSSDVPLSMVYDAFNDQELNYKCQNGTLSIELEPSSYRLLKVR